MIRPFTLLSLVAALGSGMYLYQEKHRAHVLDDNIIRTVKQTDASHERTKLLEAEWALLNQQERLRDLVAQHLQLQPLLPAQFVRLEDLKTRLPAPVAMPAEPDPTPMAMARPPAVVAQATPPAAVQPAPVQVAQAQPAAPAPVQIAQASPAAAPVAKTAPRPAAMPRPAALLAAYKPHDGEPAARPERTEPAARTETARTEPARDTRREAARTEMARAEPRPEPRRTLFAPVMPAYAPTPVAIHAPTVQTAAAIGPQSSAPFVGSALGMARTMIADPVPVASGSSLGYSRAR